MIDQMKEYNKETSQIHAPADLIRRTKEAVREEEQRLERERSLQSIAAQPKHFYGKVYKWALPVAAAAVCLILLNVSGIMFGRSMSKVQYESASPTNMDSGAAPTNDSDMGVQAETTDWAESAAVADEPIDEVNSDFDMAEAETVTEAVPEEEYNKVQSADAGAAEGYDKAQSADAAPAEDAASSSAAYENGMEYSYIKSIYGSDLWIEEVESTPAFCDNADTECVTIQGVELYVGKDYDGAWIAYAETDAGQYIISTELTEDEISRDEFAGEACEMLVGKTGNVE